MKKIAAGVGIFALVVVAHVAGPNAWAAPKGLIGSSKTASCPTFQRDAGSSSSSSSANSSAAACASSDSSSASSSSSSSSGDQSLVKTKTKSNQSND
ncbi:hypothetical protein [Asticcacaulis solisilvae]|uniref:hypothetical protein n=1 Tax=Asticcacaulis solisilvae TaxID=1217274 RepID=UPI003FD759E1